MNRIFVISIAAILLRVFLSFATFHPDLMAFQLGGKLVGEGKILDLYDYSSQVAVLNYPPVIYWFFGFFSFLGGIPWLLKLPYFIFDLSLGIIFLTVLNPKYRLLAFGLWMFNPVSLYATYMMGQFDIIPTFFTFLSFYLVTRNKLSLAALALGFGIAFKLYPLFLLFPLVILGKTIWDKFKLALLVVLPYFLSVLVYLPSSSFRSTALLAAQTSKSLYASIPVSGGEAILLFPASIIVFYLFIWHNDFRKGFWRVMLIPLLLFFVFTHYHPQWLIWITPFLILDLVYNKFKNTVPIMLIFISWLGALFFFDSSLTIGIFAPLFPALKATPDIWTLLNINIDYNFSRSILQTLFAASSVYLIFQYLFKKQDA